MRQPWLWRVVVFLQMTRTVFDRVHHEAARLGVMFAAHSLQGQAVWEFDSRSGYYFLFHCCHGRLRTRAKIRTLMLLLLLCAHCVIRWQQWRHAKATNDLNSLSQVRANVDVVDCSFDFDFGL